MPVTAPPTSPTTNLLGDDLVSILNRHHFQPQEEWRKTTKSKNLPPLPESTYYIGRGTPLGNPYDIQDIIEQEDVDGDEARERAVKRYRSRLWHDVIATQAGPAWEMLLRLARIVRAGRRINLLCSCAPKKCHGDVIKAAIAYLLDEDRWLPEWGELEDVSVNLEPLPTPVETPSEVQSSEVEPIPNTPDTKPPEPEPASQERKLPWMPAKPAYIKVDSLVRHINPECCFSLDENKNKKRWIGRVIGFADESKTVCFVLWDVTERETLVVKHPLKHLNYYCIPQGTPRTYPTRLLEVLGIEVK